MFEEKVLDSVHRPSLVVLFSLLIVGAILGFYSLGAQSVWFDEATSAIAGRSLLENGSPVLPSGNFYGRAILHTGVVALSFKVFGFGTAAGRVPSAVLGLLSIPVAYLLGSRIKNRRVGILLVFFLTFATVQVAWSRQMRMYQQLQFFFLLSFFLLERLLDKLSWKRFIPFLVSVFCMTVSHDSFGYLLTIPIVAWLIIEKSIWLRNKITNLREIKIKNRAGIATLIIIFLLALLVRGIPLGSIHRVMEWEVNYTFKYVSHFRTEMGPLFLLAVPGVLLGLLKRNRNILYILSFLLPFYAVSNRVLAFQHRYVFMLFPLLFVFSALTLDYVYEKVKNFILGFRKWGTNLNSILPVIVVIGVLIPMVTAARFTFTPKTHYDLGRTAPQGEFQPAYQYIENHWKDNDVIISTLTPVTWYYLQRSDYWISFSHWGLGTYPDKDSYTGAEPIITVENLKTATKNTQGWIVIDRMGKSRANSQVLDYVEKNFELIEKISGGEKGVWVYQWG